MELQSVPELINGTNVEYKSLNKLEPSTGEGRNFAGRAMGRGTPCRATRRRRTQEEVAVALVLASLKAMALDYDAVSSFRTKGWSSATFEGARHIWSLTLGDEESQHRAAIFCLSAAERNWPVNQAFVADCFARVQEDQLHIEALVVFEC